MVVHPLAALIRRYAFAYTATHDLAVCDELMVDDYVLRMGEHVVRGREDSYKPATRRQYEQFPGLGFTVHAFVSNGERCALWFSEHGRSVRTGTEAAWSGVSLYRWDGQRLTECRVEQDYHARWRQLSTGRPDRVRAPANDPWAPDPEPADEGCEHVVADWLRGGGLLASAPGSLDDEDAVAAERVELTDPLVEILDLLSAGSRVAFHARTVGTYRGGLSAGPPTGPASLYASGIARVEGGRVRSVRAVTDRLGLVRRMSGRGG